jgi:hypothetical protein
MTTDKIMSVTGKRGRAGVGNFMSKATAIRTVLCLQVAVTMIGTETGDVVLVPVPMRGADAQTNDLVPDPMTDEGLVPGPLRDEGLVPGREIDIVAVHGTRNLAQNHMIAAVAGGGPTPGHLNLIQGHVIVVTENHHQNHLTGMNDSVQGHMTGSNLVQSHWIMSRYLIQGQVIVTGCLHLPWVRPIITTKNPDHQSKTGRMVKTDKLTLNTV